MSTPRTNLTALQTHYPQIDHNSTTNHNKSIGIDSGKKVGSRIPHKLEVDTFFYSFGATWLNLQILLIFRTPFCACISVGRQEP